MKTITQAIRTHDAMPKPSPDEMLRRAVAGVVAQWWISQMYVNSIDARVYFRTYPDDEKAFVKALKGIMLGYLPPTVDIDYRLSIFNGPHEPSQHLAKAVRVAGLRQVTWVPRAAMWVNGNTHDGYRVIVRSARYPSERQVFPRL